MKHHSQKDLTEWQIFFKFYFLLFEQKDKKDIFFKYNMLIFLLTTAGEKLFIISFSKKTVPYYSLTFTGFIVVPCDRVRLISSNRIQFANYDA